MEDAHTLYVSIDNSDDRLSQREWACFVADTDTVLTAFGRFHGRWVSRSDDLFQNACWCLDVPKHALPELRARLTSVRRSYRQDSVAFAPVPLTEFV